MKNEDKLRESTARLQLEMDTFNQLTAELAKTSIGCGNLAILACNNVFNDLIIKIIDVNIGYKEAIKTIIKEYGNAED